MNLLSNKTNVALNTDVKDYDYFKKSFIDIAKVVKEREKTAPKPLSKDELFILYKKLIWEHLCVRVRRIGFTKPVMEANDKRVWGLAAAYFFGHSSFNVPMDNHRQNNPKMGNLSAGLHICGDCGAGKTEIYRSMLCAAKQMEGLWKFNNLPTMTVSAEEIAQSAMQEGYDINKYTKPKVLLINGLGDEPAIVKRYGTNIYPIVEILSIRADAGLCTHVSTKIVDKKKISDTYNDKVASILLCNNVIWYVANNKYISNKK